MDIIDRAKEIDTRIAQLDEVVEELPKLNSKRAVAMGKYAVDLRVAIITLRDKGTPATIAKELAKGECHDSLVAMEETIGCWEVARMKQRAIENQLSGCQSIFRHLSHT